ncbi:MAG: type II toxin-antitoxin system Phd/YefM family antitoxin [Bifidobacteriaceae bacterium]|jgi:antitoxin (DNA-binding transcriptional repressor) of toxin-antitoxin stability system|nr:type II toxin-antitoxin system Phd/YefM family antitoxin [Bifidobacteriaceae bacterium]
MIKTIGIADLQRRVSEVVGEVRDGRAEYTITAHGGDTGIAIARRAAVDPPGIAADRLADSRYFTARRPGDAVRQAQLAAVEAGRDAAGTVGDQP